MPYWFTMRARGTPSRASIRAVQLVAAELARAPLEAARLHDPRAGREREPRAALLEPVEQVHERERGAAQRERLARGGELGDRRARDPSRRRRPGSGSRFVPIVSTARENMYESDESGATSAGGASTAKRIRATSGTMKRRKVASSDAS